MYFHDGADYSTRASALVSQLIDHHDPKYGVGSMTCSIYDTAWVSMIAKTSDARTRWLFPSSFRYLVDHQQHDGGWQNESSDSAGVLNSLAALLAFCRHISQPRQMKEGLEDLKQRRSRAIYFLETRFSNWDARSAAGHSGFQPLVAKLLQMLEREGVQFQFCDKKLFSQTKQNSKAYYSEAALYGHVRTVATCSLEGRVGEIDFDRVGQHKISGSMMASPASTAAYLMNCSIWDEEAEAYLNHIVSIGDGKFTGGVPTNFPTTVFEITSVLTTLLENGFAHKDIGARNLGNAAGFLEDCMRLESGVTGFAPFVEPDADNTAKTISTLCLLGQPASPQGLVIRYETREFFKTYTQDRTPSFRTNCHVLKALLDLLPGDSEQMPQIEKTTKFLCNYWWTTNGQIQDATNASENYLVMLMSEVFMQLVKRWDDGHVPYPADPRIRDKVIISLFQALTRILQSQKSDGSWLNAGCESTAYAVISLTKLMSLSSAPRVKLQISQAIENGRRYLSANYRTFSEPEHVWTGKVDSGSIILHQAYVLAALQAPIPTQHNGSTIENHFKISLAKIAIQTKYYARQESFASVPEWLIQACLIENHLFLPQIEDVRYAVFPSDGLTHDRYFDSVPFAWIVASNLKNRMMGAEFLYQLMILSVLNRQFEDYMLKVVGETFAGCLFEVEDIIYGIFQELEVEEKDQCFCDSHDGVTPRSSTATTISDVRSVLYRFISHVLNHPYALMASSYDQAQLRSEFLSFLVSRVSQLSVGRDTSNATEQTPHPYTFAFLTCLTGNQGSNEGVGLRRDFLDTPEQQYLVADMCRHVSIINFMSENVGVQQAASQDLPLQPAQSKPRNTSFGTDRNPHTLSRSVSSASTSSSAYNESNSPISPVSSMSSAPSRSPTEIVFPRPLAHQAYDSPTQIGHESQQMTRLIDYERRCLDLCLTSLYDAGINQRTSNVLGLFVDATELSERIFRDPNVGSTYQTTTTQEVVDQTCKLDAPPVPRKRTRGSVSAARAALSVQPLIPQSVDQQTPKSEDREGQDQKLTSIRQDDRVPPGVPIEADWSWNKRSIPAARRASQASSEISRIESIMSEIDGISLHTKSKPRPLTERRTTSESDAAWTQSKSKINAQTRLTAHPTTDAEAIKLAKARLETQHRLNNEAKRRVSNDIHHRAMTDPVAQKKLAYALQTKAMEEIKNQEIKRRVTSPPKPPYGWVKAPLAVGLGSKESQAAKLHRASRLGGPKWKAPF